MVLPAKRRDGMKTRIKEFKARYDLTFRWYFGMKGDF